MGHLADWIELLSREVTDKMRAANRANARKSTGPRTEQGKHNSRRNALRHGIFANEASPWGCCWGRRRPRSWRERKRGCATICSRPSSSCWPGARSGGRRSQAARQPAGNPPALPAHRRTAGQREGAAEMALRLPLRASPSGAVGKEGGSGRASLRSSRATRRRSRSEPWPVLARQRPRQKKSRSFVALPGKSPTPVIPRSVAPHRLVQGEATRNLLLRQEKRSRCLSRACRIGMTGRGAFIRMGGPEAPVKLGRPCPSALGLLGPAGSTQPAGATESGLGGMAHTFPLQAGAFPAVGASLADLKVSAWSL